MRDAAPIFDGEMGIAKNTKAAPKVQFLALQEREKTVDGETKDA